MSRGTIVLETF